MKFSSFLQRGVNFVVSPRVSAPESWIRLTCQLSHEPEVETRNRKRLRQNPIAPWELRIQNIRVFYEVEQVGKVTILAIGKKRGNRLYIEGQEIQL